MALGVGAHGTLCRGGRPFSGESFPAPPGIDFRTTVVAVENQRPGSGWVLRAVERGREDFLSHAAGGQAS